MLQPILLTQVFLIVAFCLHVPGTHITDLWMHVSRVITTHTAEECCLQHAGADECKRYRSLVIQYPPLFHALRNSVFEGTRAPIISAKEGTLARKRQIREYLKYSSKVLLNACFIVGVSSINMTGYEWRRCVWLVCISWCSDATCFWIYDSWWHGHSFMQNSSRKIQVWQRKMSIEYAVRHLQGTRHRIFSWEWFSWIIKGLLI